MSSDEEQPSLRDFAKQDRPPSVETLGYDRLSLRLVKGIGSRFYLVRVQLRRIIKTTPDPFPFHDIEVRRRVPSGRSPPYLLSRETLSRLADPVGSLDAGEVDGLEVRSGDAQ